MNQAIADFCSCRFVAFVGVSRQKHKWGNQAFRELKRRGLRVLPVHPSLPTVDGGPCYGALDRLPERPEGVVICVQSAKVPPLLRQAAALGIGRVWLQQGAESDEATRVAQELNLSLAEKACILMHAPPVRGFHRVHRGLMRLFGRL